MLVLLSVFMLFSATSAFAIEQKERINLSKEEKEAIKRMEFISKSVSKKIVKLLEENKEELIEELPEIIESRNIASSYPSAYEYYIKNLDALDKTKSNKRMKEVQLGFNENAIIQFNDGSLIFMSTSTTSVAPLTTITPTSSYCIENKKTTNQHKIYAPHKVGDLKLITEYDINTCTAVSVKVTDAYTTANTTFPMSLISHNETIVRSSGFDIKTRGTFITGSGVIPGAPLSFFTWILETEIDAYGNITNTGGKA